MAARAHHRFVRLPRQLIQPGGLLPCALALVRLPERTKYLGMVPKHLDDRRLAEGRGAQRERLIVRTCPGCEVPRTVCKVPEHERVDAPAPTKIRREVLRISEPHERDARVDELTRALLRTGQAIGGKHRGRGEGTAEEMDRPTQNSDGILRVAFRRQHFAEMPEADAEQGMSVPEQLLLYRECTAGQVVRSAETTIRETDPRQIDQCMCESKRANAAALFVPHGILRERPGLSVVAHDPRQIDEARGDQRVLRAAQLFSDRERATCQGLASCPRTRLRDDRSEAAQRSGRLEGFGTEPPLAHLHATGQDRSRLDERSSLCEKRAERAQRSFAIGVAMRLRDLGAQ